MPLLASRLKHPELIAPDNKCPQASTPASGLNTFNVLNPATGDVLGELACADASTAENAIDRAFQCQTSWAQQSPRARADLLIRWAEQLRLHQQDLAEIITAESGKLLSQALGEIDHCATMLAWYAGAAQRITGEQLPSNDPRQRNYTIKQPVGVVAAITPWNFPAAAVIVKAGAALAAGCTVVLKPSELTPLTAIALCYCAYQSGIPSDALVAIVTNRPEEVGSVLTRHSNVAMLTFTGSTATGAHLYQQAAATIKRVALELGGNAPFIVFDDANIDLAVSAAISARFYNNGQICVGANRFYLHKKIAQEFSEKFAHSVSQLTVGDPHAPGVDLGPLIHRKACERISVLVEDALKNGARLLCGGKPLEGNYFQPTVLTNMQPTMQAFTQEIFGPIACLYEFSEEQDVVKQANNTQAGLAAYLFSGNIGRVTRVSEALRAGAIGVNSSNLFAEQIPFGGWQQSGIGKEQGIHCLDEFLVSKSICMGVDL